MNPALCKVAVTRFFPFVSSIVSHIAVGPYVPRTGRAEEHDTHFASTYFNNQLNAQILLFYNNMCVTLQSSTCFEH